MHSYPGIPPSTLFPLLPPRVSRPCKSLSSGNRSHAAPPHVQSVRIRRGPASSPTHPSLPVDRGPSFSNSLIAPALRLRSTAAPQPSAGSKQNPPLFHRALPACLSPPRSVSCTPSHRCCQIPPPRLPRSSISRRPVGPLRLLSRSACISTPLCPSRAAKPLRAAYVPRLPSIPRRRFP